jgi:hypothetical protein
MFGFDFRQAQAVAVLTRDLSDLRWGIDAAGALSRGCHRPKPWRIDEVD